ncbi:E3 ubiquitin-protein ligase RBBP6-like [Anopheles maculipalpis]|uniref:E3 ubiquitin-protein ligase RBBP6-like n=1 Tax=Anopheles maculipalpis TaxID=1496333 RepID=UPI002159813E|nr:E3 ubiquitin-protein ligase RBBP6-like [Anopheles maculipalpis]
MESRQRVLDQLKSFIEDSEQRINNIIHSLKWSKDGLLRSKCDKPKDGVKNESNRSNDMFPPSFQASESSSSIRLDNIKQAEAILEAMYENPSFALAVPFEELVNRGPPSNLADLHINFTPDERLSLYQYVMKNTIKPPDVPEIKIRFKRDAHGEEKATSLTEIAAIERDARRRNAKHRVSRNPLTYSEKVRHLIQVQTDALAHHFGQSSTQTAEASDKSRKKSSKHARKSRSNTPEPDRSHRKKKRHRSRSRERSKSGERKRHKSHKKHKRKHNHS